VTSAWTCESEIHAEAAATGLRGRYVGAKESGKLRLEGKDYPVREGDVIHFRFTCDACGYENLRVPLSGF
jgi:ribosome-binding ATPase YchF (GTP1/OBG family)